jgi:hypothetical protein
MKNFGLKLLFVSLLCLLTLFFFWNSEPVIHLIRLRDTMKWLAPTFAILGLLWPDKLMEQLWDKLTQKISAKIKNKQRNDKNEEE